MLKLNTIHYSYKSKKQWFSKKEVILATILKGLDLEVKSGELFGLIGPNGSGKSTLTKLIIGVYAPDQGLIQYNGIKVPSLDDSAWKRKIGWLTGANTRLFSTLDLNEHIELYRNLYKPKFNNDWFKKKLKEFNLLKRISNKPTEISFGERIKFELALTLAYQPDLLILDEPTVGLDVNALIEVRMVIKEYLKETNACGILTSHNLKDITEVCERGAFLKDGILKDLFVCNSTNSEALEGIFVEVFGNA